jgi:hypothetical protein
MVEFRSEGFYCAVHNAQNIGVWWPIVKQVFALQQS